MQTCIVHLIRSSLRDVNFRDRKKVASALRPIYTAPNADAALQELDAFQREWGERYPPTVAAWRACWEHVIPFLALPGELRRAVYTTNTIEGLHRQVRKAIKTRGHFPDEQPRPSSSTSPSSRPTPSGSATAPGQPHAPP